MHHLGGFALRHHPCQTFLVLPSGAGKEGGNTEHVLQGLLQLLVQDISELPSA
jgi:hypothetical protein